MELTSYLYSKLTAIPGVHVYGPPPPTPGSTGGSLRTHRAAALCAFNVQGIHPTDLSTFLDEQVRILHPPLFWVPITYQECNATFQEYCCRRTLCAKHGRRCVTHQGAGNKSHRSSVPVYLVLLVCATLAALSTNPFPYLLVGRSMGSQFDRGTTAHSPCTGPWE